MFMLYESKGMTTAHGKDGRKPQEDAFGKEIKLLNEEHGAYVLVYQELTDLSREFDYEFLRDVSDDHNLELHRKTTYHTSVDA